MAFATGILKHLKLAWKKGHVGTILGFPDSKKRPSVGAQGTLFPWVPVHIIGVAGERSVTFTVVTFRGELLTMVTAQGINPGPCTSNTYWFVTHE